MSKTFLSALAMALAVNNENAAMSGKVQALANINIKYNNYTGGNTNNTGAMQTAKNAIKSRNKARRAQNKARKNNRK